MSDAIAGLRPEPVWKYFAAISRIPRGSKNEAAVARYVMDVARGLGLEAQTDAAGNVLVRKPASKGREGRRPVVLQGHLDMVCEKNDGTAHDFATDPIRLVRQGDILAADGTTLGADNGIAVATNLAVMEDRSIGHGPLELLFTVEEETSLRGASSLAPDLLRGRTLLNLDSEEEGVLFVGCAGGQDTAGTWRLRWEDASGDCAAVAVKVSGLKGGHSGMDIDKGRGNAIKVMARALRALAPFGARLADIDGGDKHNAIPRECRTVLWLPRQAMGEAGRAVGRLDAAVKGELAVADPGVAIALEPATDEVARRILREGDQRRMLQVLAALPHGVVRMSDDIPGLVETSTNLAVAKTRKDGLNVVTFQRSSVDSALREVADSVEAVLALGGATVESSSAYPGWKPNMGSEVLKVARSAWRDLSGRDPEVTAVHAGLECGVIGEKIPGMDMISFGPTMTGVHSPDEKLHIGTVGRFWDFLLEILRRL
ncbi:MAG: aminoacyl-histidine dipeptidase [Acidobacteriota bacterium]|jgi:dipeptidase D|nr:aminoacyl-histidine dipeptidase [Acidobacteriota bacterium]